MRQIDSRPVERSGDLRPTAGVAALVAAAALLVGCSGQEEEQNLTPVQVGMTKELEPIYDDGELQLFEVKRGVAFPIVRPSDATMNELNGKPMEPYGRAPWVENEDVEVQLTWTLSNLDEEEHVVEVLIDPWNEFGRYYPGLQLTDADNQEFLPNFSGIDRRYVVPGKDAGTASRVHGTYTFDDLHEVAIDFATVMNLIADPPPSEAEGDDPRIAYTNHAFDWQNRSYRDPLVAPWIPDVIPGLTGLDVGFRTYEPATIAIEIAIELVDTGDGRVRERDDDSPLLEPTETIITVGSAAP